MFTPSVYEPEKDYTWILKQHLDAARNGRREAQSIMAANPKGRSGILVDTHNGDTSMDSTPLAYKMATRLGKRFRTLTPPFGNSIVYSNDFGYNNAFKLGYDTELNRAKALFKANPNYKAKLLKDEKGNMIAYELTDDNGTFQIPLNSRQEVLDKMNADLHKFNEHFGTLYPDIKPFGSRRAGEYWDGKRIYYKDTTPETMYPWDFGEIFELPNIYGIAYRKGGKLKRRLLTDF